MTRSFFAALVCSVTLAGCGHDHLPTAPTPVTTAVPSDITNTNTNTVDIIITTPPGSTCGGCTGGTPDPTTPNSPPAVLNPGNQTANAGGAVNLPIFASDPDGDTMTCGATGLPRDLTVSTIATGCTITGIITSSSAADSPFSVQLTVSDGTAQTTVAWLWTVLPPVVVP